MDISTFFVHAAGHRLRVQHIRTSEDSASAKPTLVFLHEGLGCIEFWRDFPQHLCRISKLNGIVYDRKGYGESSPYHGRWAKDYLVEEADVDLPSLLRACKVNDVILIGHSDGGSIALLAAAMHGYMVRGVITEAAHIFVEEETLRGIREFMEKYEKNELKRKIARFHGKETDTVVYRWADTWLDPEFRDWNIEAFLPQISCPLLVLQGTDDQYATAKQVTDIVRQVSGPAKWELIPNCDHVPHFQATDRVLLLMNDFIATLR